MMFVILTALLCVNAAPLDKYDKINSCINNPKFEMKNEIQKGISIAECAALCDALSDKGCLSFEYNEPRQECRPQKKLAPNVKCKKRLPGDIMYTLPTTREELTTPAPKVTPKPTEATQEPTEATTEPTEAKATLKPAGTIEVEDKIVAKAHCELMITGAKFAEGEGARALEAFLVSKREYCDPSCATNEECNIIMTLPHSGQFVCQLAHVPAGVVKMVADPAFPELEVSRCFKEAPKSEDSDEIVVATTTTAGPEDKMVCEAMAGATEMPGNCQSVFSRDFQDLGECEYECQHATGCNAVETTKNADGTLRCRFYQCRSTTPAPEDTRCTLYASNQKVGRACQGGTYWYQGFKSISECADSCEGISSNYYGCNALQVSVDDNGDYRCASYSCPDTGIEAESAAPCANDDSAVAKKMPATCKKLGEKGACPVTCETVFNKYPSDACRENPNFYWFADACPFYCPQRPVKCLRETDEVYDCNFDRDVQHDLATCTDSSGNKCNGCLGREGTCNPYTEKECKGRENFGNKWCGGTGLEMEVAVGADCACPDGFHPVWPKDLLCGKMNSNTGVMGYCTVRPLTPEEAKDSYKNQPCCGGCSCTEEKDFYTCSIQSGIETEEAVGCMAKCTEGGNSYNDCKDYCGANLQEEAVGSYGGDCKQADLDAGCETVIKPMGPFKVPTCQCPEIEEAVGCMRKCTEGGNSYNDCKDYCGADLQASEMTMTQQTTSWTVNDLGLYSFAAVGLGFALHAVYKFGKAATTPKTVESTALYTPEL